MAATLPGTQPIPDPEGGPVEVVVVRNECSDGSFDLASIPPSDHELVGLAMDAFKISPKLPDARQQLARKLRKKKRRERRGPPSQSFRLEVAMEFKGANIEGTAPAIAKCIAPLFPNLSEASLIQKVRRWRRKRPKPGVAKKSGGLQTLAGAENS